MTETIRSTKWARLVAAILLVAAMVGGILGATARSHAATNEEYCYNYLVNTLGLNAAAASGLLANFEEESSFNPNLYGDSGSSYGLCQWNKDRKTALISYCTSNGLDYTTLYGQLSYLNYDLRTNFPELLQTLKSAANTSTGAYNAGYRFCYDFEKPANKESKSASRASKASSNYFPKYVGATSTAVTTTTNSSSSASKTTGYYTVNTNGSNLNVRSAANANSTAVAKVTDGTRLYVSQVSGSWGKVTVDGVTGWICLDYCVKS